MYRYVCTAYVYGERARESERVCGLAERVVEERKGKVDEGCVANCNFLLIKMIFKIFFFFYLFSGV